MPTREESTAFRLRLGDQFDRRRHWASQVDAVPKYVLFQFQHCAVLMRETAVKEGSGQGVDFIVLYGAKVCRSEAQAAGDLFDAGARGFPLAA
jgi:hypothetical protein